MSLRLPCLDCAEGEQARAEIAEVYLAARAGTLPIKLPRWPSLPWTCCRRPKEPRPIDVEALISTVRT
jgi:hypothetical protein